MLVRIAVNLFFVFVILFSIGDTVKAEQKVEISSNKQSVDANTTQINNSNNAAEYLSKEDFYKQIISLKEERATDLYNMLMFVIAFFGIGVTVALGFGAYYGHKIKSHQDKINLVLDSKGFDEKLLIIQDSLDNLKKFEMRYNVETIKAECARYIEDVNWKLDRFAIDLDQIVSQDHVSIYKDYCFNKSQYEYYKKSIMEFKYNLEIELDEDEMSPEEEINDYFEELVQYGDKTLELIAKLPSKPTI